MDKVATTKNAFKEIHILDTRIQALEKEKDAQFYKKTPGLFKELCENDMKYSQAYHKDRIKCKKEVYQLKSMVNRFHDELKNIQPTPQFLETLKVIMEEIESSIMLFKEAQRETYEELMLAEVQHSHEVNALQKKFESWAETDQRVPVTRPLTSKPTGAKDVTSNLPPEVAQYTKFLEDTGGVRGGWDEYDHNTFLKWRVRFKGKDQFLREATSRLPTKTANEVRDHEIWYRELLTRQEEKRLAIKTWKEKKKGEKNEALEELSDSDSEAERQAERQQSLMEKERQHKLQKLDSWKLQRELERAEAEERRLHEEKNRKRKAQEEKLRQQELRNKVAEYKKQQKEEAEFLELEAQSHEVVMSEQQREKLQMDKERIKLRNEYALLQKTKHLQEVERKKQQQIEREKKLRSQYEVSVSRDPSRLLQPTQGWRSRTKEVGASAEAGRVYTMQHRAVPTWRQGL